MRLPQFLYIPPGLDNPELGAGLILQTAEPFYIGKVYRFKSDSESTIFLSTYTPLVYSNILGYGIYIAFFGSLTNKIGVNNTSCKEELQKIFEEMADFYKKEKVEPKYGFYKKFKLD